MFNKEIKQEKQIEGLKVMIDALLEENGKLIKENESLKKTIEESKNNNIDNLKNELEQQISQYKRLNEQYELLVQLQAEFNAAQKTKFRKETNKIVKDLRKELK